MAGLFLAAGGAARWLGLCGMVALAGCTGFAAGPRSPLPDLDVLLEGKPGPPGVAQVGLQDSYTARKVTDCFATPLRTEAAGTCRDEIVQGLMTAVNLRYAEYELGFFDANRYGNLATTLAALGLGAAGAVTGSGTTQILSAAAAAVTGSRVAISRELLQDQTSAALLTAMRAQRDIVSLRLQQGLRRPAAAYPLGVALADVYALYRAGTIPGAITGVTHAVGVQGLQAQQSLAEGTGFSTTPASVTLRNFLFAPGLDRPATLERFRRVKAAAAAEGLGDITVISFVDDTSPGAAAKQERVVRRLNLQP